MSKIKEAAERHERGYNCAQAAVIVRRWALMNRPCLN